EKTLGDKSCQRRLVDRRRVLIHGAADLDKRIDQRLRRNDVTQTQRRTKNLAHRSRVNHPAGVIDPLHRRERRSGEKNLGVEGVFKDEGVMRTGKIEQGRPARKTHRHADRKLMRRSYVDEFWQGLFSRSRNDDSLIVERLWNDFSTGQSKNSCGLLITRIFNPCGLARIEQCCCRNQHRLLHSADDHDLVRMTASRSEIAQISRKRFAQVGVAAIRRITQQVSSFLRENLCSKPFPHSYRKFIDCRNTRDKRDARASTCCSKIKLLSYPVVRKCSDSIGNAKGRLSGRMSYRLVCAQKGVRERVCYECSRFGL